MFGYFGAKHRLAHTYQPPRYGTIVEPFAGAAGYTCHWLIRRKDLTAVLVEKDPAIADVWRQLLAMTPDEITAMPNVTKGEQTTSLLVAMSSSATSGIGSIGTRGTAQVTEWMARDWRRLRRDIAWRRSHIDAERITIIEDDYRAAPDITATWFIDPPYQHQGHRYRHGSTAIDYAHLGAWCQSRNGQVIVTEAAPADWLPFRIHQSNQSLDNLMKTELVWTNQPDDQLSLLDQITPPASHSPT